MKTILISALVFAIVALAVVCSVAISIAAGNETKVKHTYADGSSTEYISTPVATARSFADNAPDTGLFCLLAIFAIFPPRLLNLTRARNSLNLTPF